MDTKGLQLEFISWCKSKKKSPKTEEETKQLFYAFMKEKHPKEYEAAMKQQQLQETLKGAHGMKLQYIKNLKHQCAEDEELYYYKKGGSVGCGCKKKEDGGEIKIAQKGTVVQKFKNRTKEEQAKIDKQSEEDYFAGTADHTKPGISRPRREEPMEPKVTKPKPVTNIKKDSSKNVKTTIQKCGGEVVKKFKKHQLGGSLNGIPFYLEGTPKGGIKEKSDNTRIQRIPNNGEAIYEATPQGYGDFVPLVGTWRAAQRIDKGEPNASYGDLIANGAMDLLGARMVGPVIKASAKASRLAKLLKSRGFNKITEQGIYRSLPNTYMKIAPKTIEHLYYNETKLMPYFKQIPTVDISGVALLPLILTLRVPATAPFK